MIRLANRAGFALLALTLWSGAASAAPTLDNNVALESFIDGVVRTMMKAESSPSGTVAIAHRGEVIFAKGYGFEDVEEQIPVDASRTLFRPGSVSKLFTWVSVMQQVEQGRLDLDADVNDYLDTFQIRDTFEEPVTLRHILTHTAGFEDGALGYLIQDDPDRIMPLEEAMAKYQPERVNPPGKQTAYSNYATAIAGLIVQKVSGTPFNDYVEQNIFTPLGMRNSSFEEPLPEPLASNMAHSYATEAGTFVDKPFEIISNFGPAGALSATATDMLRFAQAILNGGSLDGQRILRQETVDQMLTRSFTHDDRLMGMALGFYETEINGVRLVGHGGDTIYFHSDLGIDRENELAFFVSFGSSGGGAVRSAFPPALYDEYFPVAEARPDPPEGFTERAGRYAGAYGFWRSSFSKIEKALGLTNVIQVSPTADDTLLLAFGDAAKQYVEVGDNLFHELDAGKSLLGGISPSQLAFQEDGQGNISGFVMEGLPFMSLRKLPLVATPNFNFVLLGLSLLVFVLVLLRRWYQRRLIREQDAQDRSAINAAVIAAGANLLALVSGAIVISAAGSSLFTGIPLSFKLWLLTPIIATLAGLYLVYLTARVWSSGALGSIWARIRLTVVALCGLFMCWFYWYWNILGFQYL